MMPKLKYQYPTMLEYNNIQHITLPSLYPLCTAQSGTPYTVCLCYFHVQMYSFNQMTNTNTDAHQIYQSSTDSSEHSFHCY